MSTSTMSQPTPSTSARTPQEEFTDAINFREESPLNSDLNDGSNQNVSKMKSMMSNIMKNFNNSKYVYPCFAIVLISILVIIIVFQSRVSTFTKIVSILILLISVIFTIYYTKS